MLKSIDYMEFHSYYEEEVKMFFDIVQYHMTKETYLPQNLIVSSDELINHIYFIVEGTAQVEIKVNGVAHKIEQLKCRDTFGQFKIFQGDKKLHFSVSAITKVVLLKLSKEFFNLNQNKIHGLKECIHLGHQILANEDNPFLDYEIHKPVDEIDMFPML